MSAYYDTERRLFFVVPCGRSSITLDTIRLSRGELMGAITISPRGETLIGTGSLAPLIRGLRRLQLKIEADAIEREREGADK
jgi:hypothetical protein